MTRQRSASSSKPGQSTGDQRLDALISQIVQGMGDLAAPPSNLPQPLHVRISARGAS